MEHNEPKKHSETKKNMSCLNNSILHSSDTPKISTHHRHYLGYYTDYFDYMRNNGKNR